MAYIVFEVTLEGGMKIWGGLDFRRWLEGEF